MGPRVYMTLLTRPSYLPGTLVLHYSLQAVKSKYPLIVVVTRSLPADARAILERAGIEIKEVDLLLLPSTRFDPSKTEARFADIWTKARYVHFIRKSLLSFDLSYLISSHNSIVGCSD